MALKALMLRKKIDDKKKLLEQLRTKDQEFVTRESELEQAIEEAQTEEERQTVEESVEQFETEKKEHDDNKATLEREISQLESDLQEEERKAAQSSDEKKRKEVVVMGNRTKFYGMSIQERDAFFMREDVKEFISKVRTCIKEKRALSNVGLSIPQTMLDLLKEKVEETSKLIGRVNLKPVTGTARQRIMGTILEAVWTEMCATLNEMDLSFNDAEVDGYKVGGFFAVHNAIIEDNDVNLVSEILNALGKAIGKALDKAIVYGTGTKMPLGIVTRLAQSAEPSNYPATARKWEDLQSHLITGTGATGVNLFKEIVKATGKIKNDYSEIGLVWLMNKTTHTELIVQSMDKNLNAAIVAGINNAMPVIGGEIIELPFIPDNNIVFGYMDMYLLAERAGTHLGQSEHCRFVEDQTVFKGTARYDGTPLIPEAFGVITIKIEAPAKTVTFPTDKANTQ